MPLRVIPEHVDKYIFWNTPLRGSLSGEPPSIKGYKQKHWTHMIMAKTTENIDDMWKENMNEWVYEETKVVTYKWLSKQISVHVNIAKQMLFEFVQSSQSKKLSLEVVYLLAGRIALPPHSIKVCLVKSKDLTRKEAEFQSITSKHIYAVSKAQPGLLKETNLCQVIF